MSDLLTDVETVSMNRKPGKSPGYWNKQLTGAPKRIEFFTDFPRPALPACTLAAFRFSLPEEIRNKLKRISIDRKVNLSTLLLTAFNILLYRHTHQTDLVVGYVTGMNNTGKSMIVENAEKVLPVRTRLAENLSFIEVLEQIQKVINAAINHKEEAVKLFTETSPAHKDPSCFFQQVIFAFRNITANGIQNNATPDSGKKYNEAVNADLILIIENAAASLECELEYNSQLFEADTIMHMAEHFRMLLNAIAIAPHQKIAQIPILSATERKELLSQWNNTGTAFPKDKCIHELFEEQVHLNPNATAVELHPEIRTSYPLKKRRLTYADLNKRANQIAHYLQSKGTGPEMLIGVYMKRSPEMVTAILGILKAGGAYLPLDPAHPKERLNFILKDSGISTLLTQYHLITKLPTVETRVICVDREINNIALYDDETPVSEVKPQNLAYVIYTSGSTGVPKGTLIEHRSVVNYLSWCIKAYKVNEGNGCPINSSIGFDATITSFLSPLTAGKKLMLLPDDGEIEALTDALQSKNNFSLVKITPAHLEILSNLLPKKNNEGQTNALVIGGEALMKTSLNFWRKYAPATRLINEYGPTETTVGCCIYEVPVQKSLREDIPIGRPIANTQIYILDNYMQPVPTGVAGEIYIGGAGLARGYLNRPQLTSERFISNPFSTDQSARLYKTGDMARYLNDGNIIFLGRADDQVKIRGYRIELGEIEHVLQQTEGVSQATVLCRRDHAGDKQLTGYFVPDPAAVKSKECELLYQRVANRKEVDEKEYGKTEGDENIDAEFNITGWNDSFTGAPVPAPQMKEWLDEIVAIVLAEQPGNVLEIGCGTGLICYRLAGQVKKYIGCDLSTGSINQIKKRISKGLRDYGATELFTAPAHQIRLQKGQEIDTILLNSMVQYFPGEDYMDTVMENCIALIKNKGRIIIGDVRDNRLLELFKGRLRMQKSQGSVEVKEFKWALEQDLIKEEELCFSPAYFYGLKDIYPQITHVEIQWKKADYINERSLYRYTVVMYIGIEKKWVMPQWQRWDDVTNKMHFFSDNRDQKNTVALSNVPNPRLWKERLLQDALQDTSLSTVGELMHALEKEDEETVQVKQLLQVAESLGYIPKLFVHEDALKVNLFLELNSSQGFIRQPLPEKIQYREAKTNVPLLTDIVFSLQSDIRKALLNRLPEYMVPAELIALRHLPLTHNGKVDRAALPALNQHRQDAQKVFVAGRNKLEIQLTQLFERFMGINHISVQDDVFELGINSLQAYRLFAQIKKITNVQLPLSILIEAPTIERLAMYLKGKEANLPWSSLVPIQPKGTKPPLYLIHAGTGTLLFYRELSLYLGEDQPVYGLQPKGLDGKEHFHKSVEEMALHYINEIRAANPEGPYLLGGYCFGAVIAFEMAQQLISQGAKVALLANFNGVSPTYDERSNCKADANKSREHLKSHSDLHPGFRWKTLAQKSTREKFRYLSKKIKSRVMNRWRRKAYYVYVMFLLLMYKCYQAVGLRSPELLRKYYLGFTNGNMVKMYKPKPYPGILSIFRSPGIYHDPHLGWGKFVTGEITTVDIPGYHVDRRQIMNEPFVEITAKKLEIAIKQHPAKTSA